MSDETTLLTKRDELKRELLSSQSSTLIDAVLSQPSRLIQKITRSRQRPSGLYCLAMILLITLVLGLLTAILLKEEERFSELGLLAILGVGLAVASLVVAGFNIDQILAALRDSLIDAIESADDLDDLQAWLMNTRASLKSLAFSVIGGLCCSSVMMLVLSAARGGFIGFGLTIWALLSGVCFGIALYYLALIIMLPLRLGRYRYVLYEANPSGSTVVTRLARTLNGRAYLVAAAVAVLTLFVTSSRAFARLSILVVLAGWIPVTVQFLINQASLRKIIVTAKFRILSEVERETAALRKGAWLTDRETMAALNRLMDYHDRICSTPDSMLDLRAGLHLVSQLLLPVLAFVLANLDWFFTLIQR